MGQRRRDRRARAVEVRLETQRQLATWLRGTLPWRVSSQVDVKGLIRTDPPGTAFWATVRDGGFTPEAEFSTVIPGFRFFGTAILALGGAKDGF